MINVETAEKIAKEHALSQVIIFGWDGTATHIVTYGDTIEGCAQAAKGANNIKKHWGWPEDTIVESARVKDLQDQLEKEIANKELALAQLAQSRVKVSKE